MTMRAYIRCSTNEYKQDISRQRTDISNDYSIDRWYEEYSSAAADRKEFQNMLIDTNKGDTIVATEVSRLCRSTKQFVDLLEYAERKQIRLIIGSMVLDFREDKELDIMTETTLKVMSVFAELERKMLSERVKSGINNARLKGKKHGRNKTTVDNIPEKFKLLLEKYYEGQMLLNDVAKICDITRQTASRYKKIIEEDKKQKEEESKY